MTSSQNAKYIRGPWLAVLTDSHGFVYSNFDVALEELGEDHDDEMTIAVVRGTALPVEQDPGDGSVLRMPGSYSTGDMVFELDDVWLVDPDDNSVGAAARYAQAQAMAAGLNAASEAVTAR